MVSALTSQDRLAQPNERHGALHILGLAQRERFVIQDFCPFPKSIEWELGQRYLSERGSPAFTQDRFPVPFVINNDGVLSANAARLLFANLLDAESQNKLESEVLVLELGIGVGLFARFFLDAFRELCHEGGKDYYDRLRYVAGDFSERMLLDAARHGTFRNHAGHYALRVVNALDPTAGLQTDLNLSQTDRPFRAVFLNYLLDCLPATVLNVADQPLAKNGEASAMHHAQPGVSELFVRSCLARGVNLEQYTDLGAEELAEKARSGSAHEKAGLYDAFGLFASEYEYRPVDLASVPYADFALRFARQQGAPYVWHSYGAIQAMERLLSLVSQDGFILFNDYGHTEQTAAEEFEHQRFSRSTFVGLNFPLLKSYFTESGRYQWEEPAEDTGSIYARLLGHQVGAKTVECFRERFSKEAYEATQEPVQVARGCVQAGAFEAAATAYRRALEKQPMNWMLMSEVAKFLTFTLQSPEAGRAMARAAIDLNPCCSAELWDTYGDSLFVLGRHDEARKAFERALRINPKDARAYYNLTFVHLQKKDHGAALESISKALLFDEPGEFREGLMQKQSEILTYIANRHKQECMLQANRLNKYPGRPKKPTTDRTDNTDGRKKLNA